MLVLRLLVMVLSIICLMDGHAEVSPSATGIRNGGESFAVKANDEDIEILDRKKKKPKKPKKNNKKKNKKPKKPNLPKPVMTIKPTNSTTPTMKTTASTATATPTITLTSIETTTSPASTTTFVITTATTTATTLSTKTTTTTTTTATASSTATLTTADLGAGQECKATNGKLCVFPFKDGNMEYNECKNHGGTYFWCATEVYDSGKYKHWSYCPKDGSCPLEGDGECRATNNIPCVFPFKDGENEYNECADFAGKYYWCATSTNSAGKYMAWSKCPKDGSCPLPDKSTGSLITGPATTSSTTLSTTGSIAATNPMDEKVLDTLEHLVLGESRDDSLQMAHMLNKKLDTIIKNLEGGTGKNQERNSEDILSASGKLNLTIKLGPVEQLGMFVLSTVDSMKSVSMVSGDCCLDCARKDSNTELAEYWIELGTCFCYQKFKNPEVEPKTRPSNEFTTKTCGINTCSSSPIPPLKDACPSGYENIIDGFPQEPDSSQVISEEPINSEEKCKEACDDKQEKCLGFYFNTCDKDINPNRCLLLNVDNLDVTLNKNNNIFCKREPQGTFDKCHCSDEDFPCNRCLISGDCGEFDFKENEICYMEKHKNRDGYIPCGLSVAIKAFFELCKNGKHQSRVGDEVVGEKRDRESSTATTQSFGDEDDDGSYAGSGSQSSFTALLSKLPKRDLEMFTVPVGQGDSTILKCKDNGDISIIDIGGTSKRSIGKAYYKDMLLPHVDKIRNFFITHPDSDHANYFNEVMSFLIKQDTTRTVPINVFIGGKLNELEKVTKIIKTSKMADGVTDYFKVYEIKQSTTLITPMQTSTISCGHFEQDSAINPNNFIPCGFWQVHPTVNPKPLHSNVIDICNTYQLTVMAANYYEWQRHRMNVKNMNSLVMKVTPKGKQRPSILSAGDFESTDQPTPPPATATDTLSKFHGTLVQASDDYYKKTQNSQITLRDGLKSEVLLVPHHGSSSNGNGRRLFLDSILPPITAPSPYTYETYAIISADPASHNYRHPRCSTVENLIGKITLKTDEVASGAAVPVHHTVITCGGDSRLPFIKYQNKILASTDGRQHIFQTTKLHYNPTTGNHFDAFKRFFIKTTMTPIRIGSVQEIDFDNFIASTPSGTSIPQRISTILG